MDKVKRKPRFRIGSSVRVRGYRTVAKISIFYKDIKGGVRLDKEVAGFYSWNVEDLTLATLNRRAK